MKKYMTKRILIIFLTSLLLPIFMSCIHEHPDGNAEDPSLVDLGVELTLELKWNQRTASPQYPSKAREETPHRVIIQIMRNGSIVGKDEVYLSSKEFSEGSLIHKLPFKLHALEYEIAVWSDFISEKGEEEAYHVSSLENIERLDHGIQWKSEYGCGYCNDILDLRDYRNQWNAKVIKTLPLNQAASRFEIISTDINRFLDTQKFAMLNGETYTLTVTFGKNTATGFNAFTGTPIRDNYEEFQTVGKLNLPLGVYDELVIASGILFSSEEENITMNLTVHNSARLIVVRSSEFRFPIKRGTLTRVKGEFLSDTFDNNITVDNIWEGEIFIEI